jgi:hypothetical protein
MTNNGSEMVRATFTIEGSGLELDGIHDPSEKWNGWACPFLTLESVRKVEEWVDTLELDGSHGPVVCDYGVYWSNENGIGSERIEPYSFDGFTVQYEGHEVYESFYDVGRYGWVYEVVGE